MGFDTIGSRGGSGSGSSMSPAPIRSDINRVALELQVVYISPII